MPYRKPVIAFFILAILVVASLWSVYLVRPPAALPTEAPADVFSAGRAMEHVREIAREPHAIGTAAHAQVRSYLMRQLRALGLQTEVQETTEVHERGGITQVGYVYNIVGRLPGKDTRSNKIKSRRKGQAILLMAHYDSQPNTPSAGDDAAGVAAILETLRALQQNEPLQNDIIVVLTDGEEYGLYGARAFLKHPWAKQVSFVINVEGRGNQGASMTFEISPENGWVVEQFAKSAPYPFASSLTYEVYRNMPNYTDFTVFREKGISGVNSAFIDGFVHYHKMTDTPENLSQNSLQHHGSNMLGLVRHIGNLKLNNTKSQDKVFFNPIGSWLVHFPAGLNMLWAGIIAVLLVLTFMVAIRKEALTVPQVVGGFFLSLLLLAMVSGLFFLINSLITSNLPFSHGFNGVYGSHSFFIGYLLLALGFFLLLARLALQWLRLFSLVMGIYMLWALLTLVLLYVVPAAAYMLLFPLFFALFATLLVLVHGATFQKVNWHYTLLLLLGALPAILIIMPIVHLLSVVFALQLPVAAIALFTLLASLLLPLLVILEQSFSWRKVPLLPLLLMLAGGLLTMRAISEEQPSGEQPLHSHISYYLNADSHQAIWASAFPKTDNWNKQFFPSPTSGPITEVYPFATLTYLKDQADPITVPAPVAELLEERVEQDERMLRLRLYSPRGGAHFDVVLQPLQEIDNITSVTVMGESLRLQPIAHQEGMFYFVKFQGLPISKEITMELRVRKKGAVRLLLYDQSIGLPQQLVEQPLPAYVIPEQGRESNLTVVRKQYTF